MAQDETLEEFDFGDNVDAATFEGILEMDDDEEGGHEFSRSIVFGFLEQAEATFEKMDTAVEEKNLTELSGLGHFLKGSSATLGFTRVKDQCEKIQNYGNQKDETGTTELGDKKKCLELIEESLVEAKAAFRTVNELMVRYYNLLEGEP